MSLNDKRQEEIRKPMMEKSGKLFSWSNVAKQWDKEFRA
jgi:glycosyltransferase involved in cell wall biosynthesis